MTLGATALVLMFVWAGRRHRRHSASMSLGRAGRDGVGLIVVSTLVTAALVVVQPLAEASSRERPRCHGHLATIVGDASNNLLWATSGRDVIRGGGGDDRIVGRAGDDVICGGGQRDFLEGGRGNDRLYGGSQDGPRRENGGDILSGGPGDDLLAPERAGRLDVIDYRSSRRAVHVKRNIVRGQGVDRLVMDVPARIRLSEFDDTYIGTAAPEILFTGDGDDTVRTGAGDDRVFFNDDPRSGDGLDRAWLGSGDDYAAGSFGGLSVVAGRGDDYIEGTGPRLEGGPGDDRLSLVLDQGRADNERADGGTGVDSLYISAQMSRWNMATGEAYVGPSDVLIPLTGFENGYLNVWAVTGSVSVTGTGGANTIVTSSVATTFFGLDGDDHFTGALHVDTFDGGPGNDEYTADLDADRGNNCVSVEVDLVGACSP